MWPPSLVRTLFEIDHGQGVAVLLEPLVENLARSMLFGQLVARLKPESVALDLRHLLLVDGLHLPVGRVQLRGQDARPILKLSPNAPGWSIYHRVSCRAMSFFRSTEIKSGTR
jgi:hypothetical protein